MLSADIDRYVALYRAAGYAFRVQALLLRHFSRYAAARGDAFVRAETALSWAGEAPSPGQRRRRLQVVRRFARRMKVEEGSHEVPPEGAYGSPPPRRTPHIFTSAEITQILTAAAGLPPPNSLRPRRYVTLFALLVTTGLRISEALALDLNDVTSAGLTVRASKFRKDRLVPLHESTRRGLDHYLAERTRIGGTGCAVFVTLRGTRVRYSTAHSTFLRLLRATGLHAGKGHHGPRLHDLRHTFAVRSLEQCPPGHDAISRHIHALSTYLGHAHVSDTYWYLQATPHLMADIAQASEGLAQGGNP